MPEIYDDRIYAHGEDDEPYDVECNRCGKSGLHWEDDNGKWVLVDKHNEIHRCTVAAKEFEGL
jgi:ssDNA-binding Zn-finger/Zn-ribbon topoisomerase 1